MATGEDAGDDGVVSGVRQDATVSGTGVAVQAGRDAMVTVHQAHAGPVRVGVPPAAADHYRERRAHAVLVEALTAGGAR